LRVVASFKVRGRLGGPLSISITERLIDYEPLQRKRFHDGGWRDTLPPREALTPEKYALQAQANHADQTQTQPIRKKVYHFAEISAFNLLLREGMDDAFYERYLLFNAPPKGAEAKYRLGTGELIGLIGQERYSALRDFGTRYPLPRNERPKEPDLFAFKRGPDGVTFRAVEAKLEDPVGDGQLLGLALIHKVIECDVELWRFRSLAKEKKSPETYTREFAPLRQG
jgi:hypothetical protein